MKKSLYLRFDPKAAGTKTLSTPARTELIFKSKSEYERFLKNMHLLSLVRIHKTKSVYALAQKIKGDVANISKLIAFYEKLGVVSIVTGTVSGRKANTPIVNYDEIRFEIGPKTPVAMALIGLRRR